MVSKTQYKQYTAININSNDLKVYIFYQDNNI